MLIESDAHLSSFCASLAGEPAIFIDTEFVGEGRYSPAVGAIQLAAGDKAVLVDPLAVRNFEPLFAILRDPAVIKVFHAAGQDLIILYNMMGTPVAPIFDTQIAFALLDSEGQISFLNLVERITGVHLQKAHGFTDWLRRPLSQGQVEYALDDVRYLIPVYVKLQTELKRLERESWAREEFAKLEDADKFRPLPPELLYTKLGGIDRLSGQAVAIAARLAAYRDETARRENLPPGRVMKDEVLLEYARHPRKTTKELLEVRGVQPQQINRYGAGILAAIERGLNSPKISLPRGHGLSPALEPTVDFLTLCLRSLARDCSVSSSMLANRHDLIELVEKEAAANIPLLRGWRREAVGDTLLATLAGDATAHIVPGTREVKLNWK